MFSLLQNAVMALETESLSNDGMCKSGRESPEIDVEQSESQSAPPSPVSPPPAHQQLPQPLRLTNFFISEILKPEFGICQRKKPHHRDLYVNPGLCFNSLHHGSSGPLSDSPRKADPEPLPRAYHHPHHHHHPGHLSPAHSTASSTSSNSSSSNNNSPNSKLPSPSSGHNSTSPRLPDLDQNGAVSPKKGDAPILWPAWVYCTRYSDRPSSGRSKCMYYYYHSAICLPESELEITHDVTKVVSSEIYFFQF